MKIREEVRKMKKDAPFLAASSIETRNKALELIAENLKAHKEEIFCENKRGDQLPYTFTGLFFMHIIKLITVNKQAII